jgi:hypothetical protein
MAKLQSSLDGAIEILGHLEPGDPHVRFAGKISQHTLQACHSKAFGADRTHTLDVSDYCSARQAD